MKVRLRKCDTFAQRTNPVINASMNGGAGDYVGMQYTGHLCTKLYRCSSVVFWHHDAACGCVMRGEVHVIYLWFCAGVGLKWPLECPLISTGPLFLHLGNAFLSCVRSLVSTGTKETMSLERKSKPQKARWPGPIARG